MEDRIRNILIVDVDSDRKESPIIIKHGNTIQVTDEEWQAMEDMGTLCEAICTLIHYADNKGYKSGADSLRDCINHLQQGFVDASYKTN